MQSVLAISIQTVRAAVRSRLVVCMLILVLAVVLLLPGHLESVGTAAERRTMLLQYTLGLAMLLLAVVTLWSASAAVSAEVRNRRLQLVRTKPVHALQVWLGKWLGVAFLDSLLVAIVGCGVYLQLRGLPPAAAASMSERDMRMVYVHLLPEGTVGGRGPVVAPGRSCTWHFRVPDARLRKSDAFLRYRLSSSRQMECVPLAVEWQFGTAAADGGSLRVSQLPGRYEVRIPARAFALDGTLRISFTNLEERHPAAAVLGGEGVEVLLAAGAFGANYVRGLLVMACFLVFLGAVGVSAGCLLSFPVAAFTSFFTLVAAGSGPFIRSVLEHGVPVHEHGASAPAGIPVVLSLMLRFLDLLVGPLAQFRPVGLLAEGRLISWLFVVKAFSMLVLLYAGALALVSSRLLSQREL